MNNTLWVVAHVANRQGWYSISTDYEYLKKTWLSYYLAGDSFIVEYSNRLAKGVFCEVY